MMNDKMKREPGLMWQKNSLKVAMDFRICFKHDKTANFANDCLQNANVTIKIFHTRESHYTTATEEIQQEKQGKVVTAEKNQ